MRPTFNNHLFIFLCAIFIGFAAHCQTQSREQLRQQLQSIVEQYKATVGIGIINIETGDTLSVNNMLRFPMQSVYKFPLALAVLDGVDKGKLSLQQKYHIAKEDLLDETWSPLKKKYPNGNVDLTIAELLQFSVSQSDNIACDILFKLAKGTAPVNTYIHKLGLKQIEIAATEHQMHNDPKAQFTNWCQPQEMSRMLKGFYEGKYLSAASTAFLMNLMIDSANDPGRIKGMLPYGTIVAHKTGTSNRTNNMYDACNDVGIITMPNGNHIALTLFVTKSKEEYDVNRKMMAELSKAVYDHYLGRETVYFENKSFASGQDTLLYRIAAPKNGVAGAKYPLLISLHGAGARGNTNTIPLSRLHPSFTDAANRAAYPCYILVPQCPENDAWVNFPDFPNSLKSTPQPSATAVQLLALVDALIKEGNIDAGRIYLTGFSLGGEGVFDLLARQPGLFACGVPIASVADTANAAVVKDIPIWAFHGEKDTVNDVKYVRMMVQALKDAGGHPVYTEVPGAPHNCQDAAYANPELWKWMFAQHK